MAWFVYVLGVTVWAGCGSLGTQTIHVPPAQFRAASATNGPARLRSSQRETLANEGSRKHGAGLVEESLHTRGLRFGTDGSPGALFAFLRSHYPEISPTKVRRGDVLFFDTGSGCGSHAGLVETADASGRVEFREWREGSYRHSYVSPPQPHSRRDGSGKILNTFLRPKRIEDAPTTLYFAGEMLCLAIQIPSD